MLGLHPAIVDFPMRIVSIRFWEYTGPGNGRGGFLCPSRVRLIAPHQGACIIPGITTPDLCAVDTHQVSRPVAIGHSNSNLQDFP
jgi:hypothetical protein